VSYGLTDLLCIKIEIIRVMGRFQELEIMDVLARDIRYQNSTKMVQLKTSFSSILY
jgi:hypothetical protein